MIVAEVNVVLPNGTQVFRGDEITEPLEEDTGATAKEFLHGLIKSGGAVKVKTWDEWYDMHPDDPLVIARRPEAVTTPTRTERKKKN